jgi:hypothetical protein
MRDLKDEDAGCIRLLNRLDGIRPIHASQRASAVFAIFGLKGRSY